MTGRAGLERLGEKLAREMERMFDCHLGANIQILSTVGEPEVGREKIYGRLTFTMVDRSQKKIEEWTIEGAAKSYLDVEPGLRPVLVNIVYRREQVNE